MMWQRVDTCSCGVALQHPHISTTIGAPKSHGFAHCCKCEMKVVLLPVHYLWFTEVLNITHNHPIQTDGYKNRHRHGCTTRTSPLIMLFISPVLCFQRVRPAGHLTANPVKCYLRNTKLVKPSTWTLRWDDFIWIVFMGNDLPCLIFLIWTYHLALCTGFTFRKTSCSVTPWCFCKIICAADYYVL